MEGHKALSADQLRRIRIDSALDVAAAADMPARIAVMMRRSTLSADQILRALVLGKLMRQEAVAENDHYRDLEQCDGLPC